MWAAHARWICQNAQTPHTSGSPTFHVFREAAAAALSWGDAGEEALTEAYNDVEEDGEEGGDGDEGTWLQVHAAVDIGHEAGWGTR